MAKRQRLQQELQLIEQRTQELKQELAAIDKEIMQSEEVIKRLRQSSSILEDKANTPDVSGSVKSVAQSKHYKTLHLEY